MRLDRRVTARGASPRDPRGSPERQRFAPARHGRAGAKELRKSAEAPYLSVSPISVNTVLTFVPTVDTAVMMKTAMREAISAYSIAVAPDSLAAKFFDGLEHYLLLLRKTIQRQTRFSMPPDTGRKYPSPAFNLVNSHLAK